MKEKKRDGRERGMERKGMSSIMTFISFLGKGDIITKLSGIGFEKRE